MRCGNIDFIRKTLDNLRDLNHELLHSKYTAFRNLDGVGSSMLRALREQDGRIGLSVFARAGTSEPGKFVTKDNDWPFALYMKTPQGSSIHSLNDTIEFSHFDGPGFILMNASKVAHFTAKLDDAFMLIPEAAEWSIASTGLVKAEWGGKKFREKLWSPELGVCAIGLAIQIAMREED